MSDPPSSQDLLFRNSSHRSNLVYETNVASCRIWDALGFKRIGRVPGCGKLKSYPDRFVDAIIYGRDLARGSGGEEGDELVSEERFEKIKFYLKHGKYPNGADRAEKSRLRSAVTHYKLLNNDVLMLKDKEVISDPARQYEIAKQTHALGQHAGINKTTATITEKYHWRGIKDTVLDVIRLCAECEDKSSNNGTMKPATPNPTSTPHPPPAPPAPVPLSTGDASSQSTQPTNSQPDSTSQLNTSEPVLSTFDDNETPIDPQILQQAYFLNHPPQRLDAAHGQHQHTLQPFFESHAEMDLDSEVRALHQLLPDTNPMYAGDAHRGISDLELELLLTRQLQADDAASGATMEVDDG